MSDQEALRSIFAEFDKDGSGTIDMKELKDMVKAYFALIGLEADNRMIRDTCYVSYLFFLILYVRPFVTELFL